MRLRTTSMIAFPLAMILTLGAVGIVAVNARGRTGWEAYAAEARGRGVKMSLQDFLPPPVPNEENFATVPLFARVFSDDQATREKAQQVLRLPWESGQPPFSSIAHARLIDLAEWQSAFVQSGDLSAPGAEPASDVLRAIEQRFGPALVDLAEAERRPRSRFPVKWELGFAALLPHLQLFGPATKIHQLRMAAHLARHETDDAYAEFRGALRDVQALDGEPVAISFLVRTACLDNALGGVWDGLIRERWSDADLLKIESDLVSYNLLADYRYNLSGERGFMNDTFAKMRESDPATREMLRTAVNNGGPEATAAYLTRVPGYIHFNQLMLNRYYDSRVERIDPVDMRLQPLAADALDVKTMREQSSFLERSFFSLVYLTAPSLEKIEQSCLYGQTMLHLTRVACALERARRAEGAYPETLEALAPKYLRTLPHDVIDGEPLRYRRTNDGHFIVYSVATNGEDDGGTTGPNENAREHSDWVWRWPETASP